MFDSNTNVYKHNSSNNSSIYFLVVKRIIDILISIPGCVSCIILFFILLPIIYFKSPGNIIFSQTRVGKDGKKFKMYKFRSMYKDAEKFKLDLMKENKVKDCTMFNIEWDKRIIGSENGPDKGFGNFIRKHSLDEWPQFFNVLMGDMSVIGSRPPTVDEWANYKSHHMKRLSVKPGITGMWQVNGRNAITDFEKVIALDNFYIDNWSLLLDMKILIKTIIIIFKGENAK